MRGLPRYHHIYTYVFVVIVLILFRCVFSIYVNTFSSSNSLTLSDNRTIVSSSDVFELGFFNTALNSPDDDRWYLGIWYRKIPQRTYVWVANRDDPLSTSTGILKISNKNLLLLDQVETPICSWNLSGGDVTSPVVAELLDNGNLVLKELKTNNQDGFLWQSFDFPTDTLLPQMKLGWDLKTKNNRFLRSWRGQYDPSSGQYSYKLETRGLPQFYLWSNLTQVLRSGPWDGIRFSGIPDMQEWNNNAIVYNFTDNREEKTFTIYGTIPNFYSRLTITSSGSLELASWIPTTQGWNTFWSLSTNPCDLLGECGPYSYCDASTSPMCNCIKGFDHINYEWKLGYGSSGCERRTPLSCNDKEFLLLQKMKWPDTTEVIVDRVMGFEECKGRCISDCNCTAFANENIPNGGPHCVIWTRELKDMRNYVDSGQDLHVRVAAADIGLERNTKKKFIALIVGVSVILLLSFIIVCFWKRNQNRAKRRAAVHQKRNQDLLMNGVVISSSRRLSDLSAENITEDIKLPLLEFQDVVMATKNFSDCNKLGQGGFGSVYKGTLANGQEIAVKRLSEMSHQGTNEFKNEVKLIARLQHINLVRILGCCFDSNEKVLIYEYLENSSLDRYLFERTRSSKLNWQKRFDIAKGIARGILYLHQDSRCRIIHRDLKASNVLLDKDMTPKISDFGMARIFARDDGEAITRRIVGTYGYMSPEYAMDGIFSVKSDVFSFGVLVLEIVSGKRNRGFFSSKDDSNLLSYTWRNWKEGKGLEILDPVIADLSSSSAFRAQEILRCIQIALLCVQDLAEDRPTMSSVILMLGSETALIPEPKPPGFCFWTSPEQDDESFTVNQITLSVIDVR